jgi:hypothetical protein
VVAACGGSSDRADAVATATPATAIPPSERTWKKVSPAGDCECADGSEFAFWERRANPTKVVFFLDGGGACFRRHDLRLHRPWQRWRLRLSIFGEDPAREGRIFDFARADNPFRDYSFLYVPSYTGDAHLGDVTREYSPELTVEHNAFVNGTAALSHLAEHRRPRRQRGGDRGGRGVLHSYTAPGKGHGIFE